jgi:uncharacterized protein (DUF1330 family)
MAAYLIADIDIDPASYEHYKRQVASVIEHFGGRYLAHGGKHEVLEGDWEPRRLIVLEFPDRRSLEAWYASPEYAPIRRIREQSANSRLVLLDGL